MELWQGSDDVEAAQDQLEAAGLTDGLPVIPATPERVERMLAALNGDPAELVAELPPLWERATWRDIAVNAVMAGCRPGYLPIVGAAIEAIAADEFGLMSIATTTGSVAPVAIVNGPSARALMMNSGGNALGPGNRANATIGRAISLSMRNIGGARPGEFDMATLGQPAKYTCCFAENEDASPWPALHVERGFPRDASVVTAIGASGIVEVAEACSDRPEDLAQTFAESMLIAGNLGRDGLLGSGEPLVVLPPELAQVFADAGCSKDDVKRLIFERAIMPLERLSPAVQKYVQELVDGRKVEVLHVARRPEDILIVVAGGVGAKAAYLPTWGGGTKAVSRRVRQRSRG